MDRRNTLKDVFPYAKKGMLQKCNIPFFNRCIQYLILKKEKGT